MQQGVPEPQSALDKIKIIENGDPLVDLREIPALTFKPRPDNEFLPYLRAPVAAMLKEAAAKIDPQFRLHVVYALRNYEMQSKLWTREYTRYQKMHPEWPEHILRRIVNKYVAPVDHRAPPGHCTGGAVDVVLQKLNGSFVDFITPELKDWSLGHTWTDKIDPKIRELRMHLVETMFSVGFSNCRDEYWHYSWGDSGWAVRTGKAECPYGVVSSPYSGV